MSGQEKIIFNSPSAAGREIEYIRQAIEDNRHLSGDGIFTRKCSEFLEKKFDVKKAYLTTSCTDALEMSALLLNIKDGDEVIFPSFTFVSTLNAFVLRGAVPVYADIRPDTLNIDEKKLEGLITQKTKAIVLVHYAGVGCEMNVIMPLAKKYKLAIIEDNAHGLFGKYEGKWLGSFGAVATQSFHETKNFTCGEGGALLVNDSALITRAEILREKGTNRSRFFRGEVDKYSWVDVGSSFLPSDILAAFLFAQFENADVIQNRRRQIWQTYRNSLETWSLQNNIKMPFVPTNCDQAYHMFYILCPSLEVRTALIKHLKAANILSVFHYLPLHLSEMGKKLGGERYNLPVTEAVSEQLLRFPFYNSMTNQDLERVISEIQKFKI